MKYRVIRFVSIAVLLGIPSKERSSDENKLPRAPVLALLTPDDNWQHQVEQREQDRRQKTADNALEHLLRRRVATEPRHPVILLGESRDVGQGTDERDCKKSATQTEKRKRTHQERSRG
jgi:hypothetical protein